MIEAGAKLVAGVASWNAWCQAPPTPMPTIPIECVPPVAMGQASSFAPEAGPVRIRKSVFELNAGGRGRHHGPHCSGNAAGCATGHFEHGRGGENPFAATDHSANNVARGGEAAYRCLVRIDGIEIPADRSATVQVFVNRPDVSAPAQGPEPGYAGSITIVPSTAARTLGPRTLTIRNFAFPLPQEEAAALSSEDNLSVTLVSVTGPNRPPEVLRYRHVYLAPR